MASKNASIVEKAKRLVDTCRERSLKHDDDAPAALFQLSGCDWKKECNVHNTPLLEEANRLHQDSSRGRLSDFIDDSGRTVHSRYCLYGDYSLNSMYRCLCEYSKLRDEMTLYDGLLDTQMGQFSGWERGLCLLADFFTDDRHYQNDHCWSTEWQDLFDAIGKAALPFTQELPKDLKPATWFLKHTTVNEGDVPQITPELLRNAVRDGRLKNWKPVEKPNATNIYSIQDVKELYKEHTHLLPNE